MKIYKNRDNKRQISCGYCWETGHNKRQCEHLKLDYLDNKDWSPDKGSSSITINPRNRTYLQSINFRLQQNFYYAKGLYGDDATKKSPKKPTTRKAPSCGFCGSKKHTRRKCSEMTKFVKILEETNRAYREVFYDKVIKETGFGLGAVVEVGNSYAEDNHYYHNETSLVSTFDLDSISIGNLLYRYSDYSTNLSYSLTSNTTVSALMDNMARFDPRFEKIDSNLHPWSNRVLKVIAPSPNLPDREWFLGQSPAFDWVVKKKSLKELYCEYGHLIALFHPQPTEIVPRYNKKTGWTFTVPS